MDIEGFAKDLAWYDLPSVGWRMIHVASRIAHEWSATVLGYGLLFQIDPRLTKPVDPISIRKFHSERRDGRQYDCYTIASQPGLDSPYYWLVLHNGYYAGGEAAADEEAKQSALKFLDEHVARLAQA